MLSLSQSTTTSLPAEYRFGTSRCFSTRFLTPRIDHLYVLADSYTAPGGYIFKATAVETINPQPGEEADKKPDDNSGQTVNPENKPDNVKTGIVEDSQTAAFLCAGMLILAVAGLAAYRKKIG